MTDYNDFGFTAMDADELASVDTKIVAKTTSAVEVIKNLDDFIRPLLENLAKDALVKSMSGVCTVNSKPSTPARVAKFAIA